ncbi:MAG: M20/M25/M40 family metallo-hydrolase, partial [Methanocorpusculum sp.]|nr:M20/M25/M40 family metallo-hydrolase [Methanocorpusculum sp.]
KILLNLDHEDGDSILAGCAGGGITEALFTPEKMPAAEGRVWRRLFVSGLLSGHSGIDIASGRANALKVAAGFFAEFADAEVTEVSGGTKSNVIPKEAAVLFSLPPDAEPRLNAAFAAYERRMREAYRHTDAGISLRLEAADAPESVWTPAFSRRFLRALNACPSGVLAFMDEGEGRKQVLTSTNLAASGELADGRISVVSLTRSAENEKRDGLSAEVAKIFADAGAEVNQFGKFPGWLLPKDAPLISTASSVYEKMFGRRPEIITTHGGVECGMIQEKYPDMQIISLGPTITGCHTPEEQLSLASLADTERFLFALIRELTARVFPEQ